MALEASKIVKRTINEEFTITFKYPEMNTVMRFIKDEGLKIISQKMELDCEFVLSVRKKEFERIFELFQNTYKINIIEET